MYTLDCEVRTALDAAAYMGFTINESDFIEHLPKSDDPNKGFVGEISGPIGRIPPEPYGVYAKPIASVLQQFSVPALARSTMTFTRLQEEIAAGRPVIVWVVGAVEPGFPIPYTTGSNEVITVAYWEHTVVVVGYDEDLVYVIDPTYNTDYVRRIETFKRSWSVLGYMAVVFQEIGEID